MTLAYTPIPVDRVLYITESRTRVPEGGSADLRWNRNQWERRFVSINTRQEEMGDRHNSLGGSPPSGDALCGSSFSFQAVRLWRGLLSDDGTHYAVEPVGDECPSSVKACWLMPE